MHVTEHNQYQCYAEMILCICVFVCLGIWVFVRHHAGTSSGQLSSSWWGPTGPRVGLNLGTNRVWGSHKDKKTKRQRASSIVKEGGWLWSMARFVGWFDKVIMALPKGHLLPPKNITLPQNLPFTISIIWNFLQDEDLGDEKELAGSKGNFGKILPKVWPLEIC